MEAKRSGANSASDGGDSQQSSLQSCRAGESTTKGAEPDGGGKSGKWRLLTSVGVAADLLHRARPTFRCYRELAEIQPLAQVID